MVQRRSTPDLQGAISAPSCVRRHQNAAGGGPDRHAEAIARKAAKQPRFYRIAGAAAGTARHADRAAGSLPDLENAAADGVDIFALYGRTAELTRICSIACSAMRQAGVLRDIVIRTGQRIVVSQLSGGVLRTVVAKVGVSVSKRVAGNAASRWIPVAGAAAVGVCVLGHGSGRENRAPAARRSALDAPPSHGTLGPVCAGATNAYASGGAGAGVRAQYPPASSRGSISRRCRTCRSFVSRHLACAARAGALNWCRWAKGPVDRQQDDQRAPDARAEAVPHGTQASVPIADGFYNGSRLARAASDRSTLE